MRIAVAGALVVTFLSGSVSIASAEHYTPGYDRIRAGLQRESSGLRMVGRITATEPRKDVNRTATRISTGRDSVWNGMLIGAGLGAGGGYLWARNICGSNDSECFFIAAPVGVLVGAGIGAAVGGIVDALNR